MKYAFSLDIDRKAYDVYYFNKAGKDGTLAFTKNGDKFVIVMVVAGRKSKEETELLIVDQKLLAWYKK